MKPTTLLLLLSLSAAVPARLISGTVNLTKDTTGINFVNDTIQLVTNDTCKYPDCKRVYYCGDMSAPDLFFTPFLLGELRQHTQIRFNIGSVNPIYSSKGTARPKELDTLDLTNTSKFIKFDTIKDTGALCILPATNGGLILFQENRPIDVCQSAEGKFILFRWLPYYSVLSFNPTTGETWYNCHGITIEWWLQPNGKPEFPELSKTNIRVPEIQRLTFKNPGHTTYYTIRGQRIATKKLNSLSDIQVLIADDKHIISIVNKNK